MDPELIKALDTLGMTHAQAIEKQASALKDYRDTAEANATKRDAAVDEKLKNLQDELAKFEPLNEAINKATARADEDAVARKELQDSIDRVEARVNRPGNGNADVEEETRAKAFEAFARKGMGALAGDYQNVLQVSDDSAAGVLANPELVKSILKEIEEYSPLRGLVTVRTTSQRSVQQPRRTGLPDAVWVGETEQRPDTEGLAFGMLEIPVHEATMAVPVSNQMLEDTDFNLMDEIREAVSFAYAKQEGLAVINGNKVGKPEGFLNAAGTVGRNTGAAATLTADSILKLPYALKSGYADRGQYVLNNTTLGEIVVMKDGDGQYLWQSGLAAGRPSTIGGKSYVSMPDMPIVGAGLKPIAFGDWKRGYTLVDRLAMSMLRDDYTRAGNGQVLFRWRRRLGGAVSIAEAIAILTVAA